ncbi:MAG: GDP-mannose 4,6-dehydratase, partial [Pseudomonadota bacterium]
MKLLVTGGAGFIGSAVAKRAVADGHTVCVFDALTYAGSFAHNANLPGPGSVTQVKADICDAAAVAQQLNLFKPDTILHLAAESHVDG